MTIGPVPLCYWCAHFREPDDTKGLTCEAHPNGIPDRVLFGGTDSPEPCIGAHGIRFKLKEGHTAPWVDTER